MKVEFGTIFLLYPHKNRKALMKKLSNYTSLKYAVEDSA